MTLYQNKYRVESTRLKGWDYSSNGYYFVTICTLNRVCYFGEIVSGEVNLSKAGELARDLLIQIPDYFPNFRIDEFIIMPNHVHGILIIDNDLSKNTNQEIVNCVTTNAKEKGGVTGQNNPMLSQDSLSKAIRWYKGRSKHEIGKFNPEFFWQKRFHESIIKDEQGLDAVRQYIIQNPLAWEDDKENPVHYIKGN
ncbi:hypothetical protein NIES4071_60160 [Calothrix sp. NIES-4071]|nr:hypothetical protein NIES4071_60160 [Calothrix sp. NIES-4071]BAZ60323.1 hypothetical protein NIES4105_60110 [Calothrix sp. NIES-4105]